jgi:hypothetical protein
LLGLVSSNLKPISKLGLPSYEDVFTDLFYKSTQVSAITGYVSEASLADLQYMIRNNSQLNSMTLTVGMAKFDGLSVGQIGALRSTHDLLVKKSIGQVLIPTGLPVHSKVTTFSSPKMQVALLGSSNLSGIAKGFRQYNTEIVTDDSELLKQIAEVQQSIFGISRGFDLVESEIHKTSNGDELFDGFDVVSKSLLPPARSVGHKFRIPLKCEQKSNLNVYFGRGRSGGRLPRPG